MELRKKVFRILGKKISVPATGRFAESRAIKALSPEPFQNAGAHEAPKYPSSAEMDTLPSMGVSFRGQNRFVIPDSVFGPEGLCPRNIDIFGLQYERDSLPRPFHLLPSETPTDVMPALSYLDTQPVWRDAGGGYHLNS